MKILHINSSNISGGAARAAFRLHKGLQASGIDSMMLVDDKQSNDDSIFGPKSNMAKGIAHFRIPIDHLPKLLYRNRKPTNFHLQWLPDFLIKKIRTLNPHIVHLHWICRGFINLRTLARIKQPIVWTLHDMWPFTGGCHYAGDCEGYKKSCGACPQLASRKNNDLSRWTWTRKAKAWSRLNLTLVAPSHWMKMRTQQSSQFRDKTVEVIPNGIDINRFSPLYRKIARSYLNFPQDKHLILFGALNAISDKRKGFQYLEPCLQRLSRTKTNDDVELIVFGASKPPHPPEFGGIKTTYMGKLQDEISISMVYAACDVFIAPSVEDNLPNTVMEAMACGTPCVAFRIGGIFEMLSHKKNGYLANPFSVKDLARGVEWVIENEERHKYLSIEARKKVETAFCLNNVAKCYTTLYEKIFQN